MFFVYLDYDTTNVIVKIGSLSKYRGNGGTTGQILHLLLSFVCFSSY